MLIDVALRSLDGGTYSVYAAVRPGADEQRPARRQVLARRARRGGLVGDPAPAPPWPARSSPTSASWRPPTASPASATAGPTSPTTPPRPPLRAGARRQRGADRRARARRPSADASATLALGFGASADAAPRRPRPRASAAAGSALTRPPRRTPTAGTDYLDSVSAGRRRACGRCGRCSTQYHVAAMTLKAHEDKTYRGANIASLTVPWGGGRTPNEAGVGGYHLVWSRDLYQVATAQIALGDIGCREALARLPLRRPAEARRVVPAELLLDGTPYWGSLQLDEVAFPLVLAWQLGRTDRDDLRRARQAGRRLHRRPRPVHAAGALGGGGRLLAQHHRRRDRRPDGRRLDRRAERRRGVGGALPGVADDWRARSRPGRSRRPARSATASTTCASTTTATRTTASRSTSTTAAAPSTSARSSTPASSTSSASASSAANDRVRDELARPRSMRTIKVETPNGAVLYRYNHDGYGEKADGSPYDGTGVGPAVAAAVGRARRVRAGARPPCRDASCARSRRPPTRGT